MRLRLTHDEWYDRICANTELMRTTPHADHEAWLSLLAETRELEAAEIVPTYRHQQLLLRERLVNSVRPIRQLTWRPASPPRLAKATGRAE